MRSVLRALVVATLTLAPSLAAAAVCTPDPAATGFLSPAPWRPGAQSFNLATACVGTPYAQTLTIITPSTITQSGVTVGLTSVTLPTTGGIADLPSGITYACEPANCVFVKETPGCILLSGTPDGTNPAPATRDLVLSGLASTPLGTIPVVYPNDLDPDAHVYLEVETCPTATATAGPAPTATVTATPTPVATPPPSLTAGGKAAVGCQKQIGKATAAFVTKKLASLARCGQALFACAETIDAAKRTTCGAKAAAACTKALAAIAAAESKLRATIASKCASVAIADVRAPAGLGFDARAQACLDEAATSLATIADVATCVAQRHECRAEEIGSTALPRLRPLLVAAGIDPSPFACLANGASGDAGTTDPDLARRAVTCAKGIGKASAKLAAAFGKRLRACHDSAFACVQEKAGDASCRAKTDTACAKQLGAVAADVAAFDATVAKTCGAAAFPALAAAEVLDANGAAATCASYGVAPLATLDDFASCIERRTRCAVERAAAFSMPRLGELLGFANASVASSCPPP